MAQCPCHMPGTHHCGKELREKRQEFFRRDIDDITDSVMQVMRICGLMAWEVRRTREVIRRSFEHYDEVRYKIDLVPRKRFCKETFIHGLAVEAQMSRMDSQIAYSIVKRAFKAYYHGTAMEGKRLKSLMEGMKHSQQCLWLHAAKRTAEIYAAYAGLMHSEMLQFAERFECVYKSLYDVLCTRVIWDDENHCRCAWTSAVPSQISTISTMTAEMEVLFLKQNMAPSSAPSATAVVPSQLSVQVKEIIVNEGPPTGPASEISSKSSRYNYGLKKVVQKKSSSKPPTVQSLQGKPRKAYGRSATCSEAAVAIGSSEREAARDHGREQPGPVMCARWLRYDEEEEQFKEHRVPFPPMEVICPPCHKDDLPCDPECTCTCDICTCQPAYDEGAGEEEHHGERLSATGIEDHDTDYCWLAPFRDWPRVDVEPVEEPEEEASMTPNSEEEEALFQCRCTCEIKQRAFPHLFTYLAPFKPIKPAVEEVPSVKDPEKCEEEEGTEDLLAKPPPCGVSPSTYRCWLQPTPPPSDPESVTEEQPHIAVLAQDAKPKVAGISMDVTVKRQHHQKGSEVAKPSGPAPASKSQRSSTKTPNLRISIPAQAAAPKAPAKPAPTAVPAPAPAPVATPPAAKPPPTQAPAQVNQEEKLTKEDILNIIGL
ncbi:GL11716 [Drosophila persimilis]|uniref:GL11716 n=1 Tax=Drosophila persimilis TaxID=7234 RepID=B4GD89_DROPE|nr:GL11716 [Drosophila persimilis]